MSHKLIVISFPWLLSFYTWIVPLPPFGFLQWRQQGHQMCQDWKALCGVGDTLMSVGWLSSTCSSGEGPHSSWCLGLGPSLPASGRACLGGTACSERLVHTRPMTPNRLKLRGSLKFSQQHYSTLVFVGLCFEMLISDFCCLQLLWSKWGLPVHTLLAYTLSKPVLLFPSVLLWHGQVGALS